VAAVSEQGVSMLLDDGVSRKIERLRPGRRQRKQAQDGDELRDGRWVMLSPITGAVVEVAVGVGDLVEAGSVVVIIEAMKMQNELRSRFAGTVTALHVELGARVELGMPLLEVTPPPEGSS
jgi:biotin carboxyl carrier protein